MPHTSPEELFSAPEKDGVVMASWERFLERQEVPASAIRTTIGRSWYRCAGAEVDYRLDRAPTPIFGDEFERIRQTCLELIDASTPVMASAHCVNVRLNRGILNLGNCAFRWPGAAPKIHSSILPFRSVKYPPT